MSFQDELNTKLKGAMREKNTVALESLRAIKSAILLLQTQSGANETPDESEIIKLLQKLVKQRKESASIFRDQGRDDLAELEEAQMEVISQFLPKQLSSSAVEKIIDEVIEKVGAKNAFGFDLAAACSGFLFSVATAAKYIESGSH